MQCCIRRLQTYFVIDFLVKMTFIRMSIAITCFTLERIFFSVKSPRFLQETFGTLVTIRTRCIMLTQALKQIGRILRGWAKRSVTITNTATANRNFFDTIVVLKVHIKHDNKCNLCCFCPAQCVR